MLVIDAGEAQRGFLLELEPSLAASLVDRALGGDGGLSAPLGAGAIGATERGILAYLAARALSALTFSPLRVRAVLPASEVPRDLFGDAPMPSLGLDLRLGEAEFKLRLFLDERNLSRPSQRPPRPLPAELELDLIVELGQARLRSAELMSARPGDILIVDELFCASSRLPPSRLRARIEGGSRTNIWIRSDAAGLRVEAIETTGLKADPPVAEIRTMPMMTPTTTARLLETVGDARLELSIEIARLRLSLEELAALSEDMVLLSGRPLLEPVVLRLSGRPWAKGELVDIEGEVGVRILQLGERPEPLDLDDPFDDQEAPTRVDASRRD